MPDHTPYPLQFPTECFTELFSSVREGKILEDIESNALHAWNIQGYLMSKVIGDPGPLSGESFGVSQTDLDEVEQCCARAIDDLKAKQYTGGSEAAIDPATIILIIEVIAQLIKLFRR